MPPERREDKAIPANSGGASIYWPMDLLDDLPQVVLDVDLETPEILAQLSGGRVRATLFINSQGKVDSLGIEAQLSPDNAERLQSLLTEQFAKALFIPAKVKGRPVAAAIPITVGVRP